MGVPGAESLVTSPRQTTTVHSYSTDTLGTSSTVTRAARGVRSDVERSMMAYTEKARLLMSTSLPDGLNFGTRFYQPKAFFSPVTWSQPTNAVLPPPGYDMDYSFPHFKEREDMLGLGAGGQRSEEPPKSALKLFVGKDVEKKTATAATQFGDRPPLALPKHPHPTRSKKKSKRSTSVASIQSEKSRGMLSTLATIPDDGISHLSFKTRDSSLPPGAASYRLALDSGSGNETAVPESEISGSVSVFQEDARIAENRSAKLQHGAYSLGRMFPPRNTHHHKLPGLNEERYRKRSHRRPNHKVSPPHYVLVGRSESVPNNLNEVEREHEEALTSRTDNTIEAKTLSGNSDSINRVMDNNIPRGITSLQLGGAKPEKDMTFSTETEPPKVTVATQNGENEPKHSHTEKVKKKGKTKTVVNPNVVNLMPV